jgi:hypothetical protein
MSGCPTTPKKLQLRRDTAANWSSTNPKLLIGEPGVETDTGKLKIGDGVQNWNQLPYTNQGGTGPTGPTGPAPPSFSFDGGFPDTVYTFGPLFAFGGVT